MGRRKIEIQPLTDDRNRTVTFVKRKAGLFKKAHELSVLCQVDIAVIILGSNNKLYEFSSVDTKELINAYQKVKVPHESKSPENYGNYKRKRHLGRNMGVIRDDVDVEEDDSDYSSDSSDAKRRRKVSDNSSEYHKSGHSREHSVNSVGQHTSDSMQYGSYRQHVGVGAVRDDSYNMSGISRPDKTSSPSNKSNPSRSTHLMAPSSHAGHSRPVLRVQIPTDTKDKNPDSARTITAIHSNMNDTSGDPTGGASNIDNQSASNLGSRYSNFSSFKSPEDRKPITTLPVPVYTKSQSASPSGTTAPSLPLTGINSFFGSVPQSQAAQYGNNVLPTPVLNQVLNQSFSPFQATNPGNQVPQSQNDPQQLQQNVNLQNNPGNNQGQLNQSATDVNSVRSRQAFGQYPLYSGVSQGGNGAGGEQTPMSGHLPSRYINDMFPSPSNFYAPQDWPNPGTGMTPIHTNLPQYLMNVSPSSSGLQSRVQYIMQNQAQNKTELTSPSQFMAPFSNMNPQQGSNADNSSNQSNSQPSSNEKSDKQ
ncbi:Piso0_005815 [Millerozyma farinosa CBS 7064]|uniref:Piso0_005815 protein n=1 Tax=Pichia sorbitophila (strain ATCC MYA-4447 / BCRC 22081 / CBS 7064 / NBRC 10061 / NRRL Y-12695) TaxID=559304 RepID=G8Y300_PICSO|nr:Piso0_005815 [Millerozyma farinosa CBS 7064]